MERISVLITGAGSELAFSLFKACRLSKLPLRLVACDMTSDALGLYWAERAFLVPGVRSDPEGFLKALRKIIKQEEIRAVFPTPDAELEFLPPYREMLWKDHECWLMINPPSEMARFTDKWLAYKWYADHGLPAPRTARADNDAELKEFQRLVSPPFVLKPRIGGGSRSIFVVRNFSELQKYLPAVPHPLVQEYLAADGEEYTAGTFRTNGDKIHVLILRRDLKFGMTNKAEVVFDSSLVEFCRDVIKKTNLIGMNNIQFRRPADGPKILEINPRFSGSTGIRAFFGFNEPEMVIRQYVLGEEVSEPTLHPGKVLRYMHEEYVREGADESITDLRNQIE